MVCSCVMLMSCALGAGTLISAERMLSELLLGECVVATPVSRAHVSLGYCSSTKTRKAGRHGIDYEHYGYGYVDCLVGMWWDMRVP